MCKNMKNMKFDLSLSDKHKKSIKQSKSTKNSMKCNEYLLFPKDLFGITITNSRLENKNNITDFSHRYIAFSSFFHQENFTDSSQDLLSYYVLSFCK